MNQLKNKKMGMGLNLNMEESFNKIDKSNKTLELIGEVNSV